MKVVGLVCSPRRKKHTYDFVDLTLKKLEEKDVKTKLLYLRDYELKPCVLCDVEEEYPCLTQDMCPRKDDGDKLYNELSKADGIVVGTPVFNGTIPEYLHSLISHAGFPGSPFHNKVTACIVIGWLGCMKAVSELTLWLAPSNYYAGYLAVNNRSPSLHGEQGLIRAPQNMKEVKRLADKIYEGLQIIKKTDKGSSKRDSNLQRKVGDEAMFSKIETGITEATRILEQLSYETEQISPKEFYDYMTGETPTGDVITLHDVLENEFLMVHEVVEMCELKKEGTPINRQTVMNLYPRTYEIHFTAMGYELTYALYKKDFRWIRRRLSLFKDWFDDPNLPKRLIPKYKAMLRKFSNMLQKSKQN